MDEIDVINCLERLQEMPSDLWLFCNGNFIYLMRKRFINGKWDRCNREDGSANPDHVIEAFVIDNDGGDW